MKRIWIAAAIVLVAACRSAGPGDEVQRLLTLPESELDKIFMNSPAGTVPSGQAEGTALVQPGTSKTDDIAAFINTFGWKGKVFDPASGTLINRLGVGGSEAVLARVYVGKSLVDGKDCIVLDYSKTSLVANHIRDEIRQIGPKTYLGPVYWDNKKLFYFALQF